MRQKELFKEEIIHQLELHPSRLDKEKIISEAMEQGLDDFFEGIRMALDPLVTFGVKIVPEKENEKSQNFLWKDFRVLANKLIQRELTGHAARDAILTAMESANKEEWNGFYRRVLIKDLRCGVSEKTINKIWAIGGDNGWYYGTFLWKIRGFIDQFYGGTGLRRGRRSKTELLNGDALDFWRVIYANKNQQKLLLYAEMKLPGEAWLEFKIEKFLNFSWVRTEIIKGFRTRMFWDNYSHM